MALQRTESLHWSLLQLGIATTAFSAGLFALVMTFPTPPLFDVSLIDRLRPVVLVAALALGAGALLLTPWTIGVPGRWLWVVIVSITMGAGGFGLGVFLTVLIARAA